MSTDTIKGTIYDGYVFNDVELSLLDEDRRKKLIGNGLFPYNYILFDDIKEDVRQFVLDVKMVAKALCSDKRLLFDYLLSETIRQSAEKLDVESF